MMSTSCAGVNQRAPYQPLRSSAQELPKPPWQGTGLPSRISGPLNRRLGLFGCSSAAESGPLRPMPPRTAGQTASGLLAWMLVCPPGLPAVRLSLSPFRNRHLSQNSPIPIWES